ncbi:MAG: hypothetical protein ACLSHU_13600 [Oscillospiraceae bacterium]
MSPVWNPAFDLGIGILLLYLWVKRRQRPYWQGFWVCRLCWPCSPPSAPGPPRIRLGCFPGSPPPSCWPPWRCWLCGPGFSSGSGGTCAATGPTFWQELFFLVLAYALSYLPSLPLPVAELQAQNSVLTLLSLLVLGFLHRQHLYLGRPALTVGIALLILATLFLFCWGYYQLPPEQMLEQLPYFRWVPFCCSVVFCF